MTRTIVSTWANKLNLFVFIDEMAMGLYILTGDSLSVTIQTGVTLKSPAYEPFTSTVSKLRP
jgi:hypothetical protein